MPMHVNMVHTLLHALANVILLLHSINSSHIVTSLSTIKRVYVTIARITSTWSYAEGMYGNLPSTLADEAPLLVNDVTWIMISIQLEHQRQKVC